MTENKKWLITTVIAILAAGGGITTWFNFFRPEPEEKKMESLESFNTQTEFFESFDVAGSYLENFWEEYEEGFWTVEMSQGSYCYTNTMGATDVKYQYLGLVDQDISDYPVSVEVKSEKFPASNPISGGGMLYRFTQQANSAYYYAFTLTADGTFHFYKRNRDGFNTLYSGKADVFKPGDFNKLAMVGKGPQLYLYVNNTLVKMIEDHELETGETGIIAVGIGRHCFDNIAIHKKS